MISSKQETRTSYARALDDVKSLIFLESSDNALIDTSLGALLPITLKFKEDILNADT